MAREIHSFMYEKRKEGLCTTLVLTKKEAAEVIGLLAAQLASEPLVNNHLGAAPTIRVLAENGNILYFLHIVTEPNREENE